MTEAKDCFDCKFYNASVGEKGYCTLYRHETVMPEIACIKYEKQEDEPKSKSRFVATYEGNGRRKIINALMFSAFAACTVLTVIGLMLGAYLNIAVFSIPQFPTVYKVISVLLTAVIALFVTHMLFILAKKYITARIIELVLAVAVVIIILVNYDTIWFNFTNLTVHFVNLIFKSYI